jgi:broad specificity phosphatase PhoE
MAPPAKTLKLYLVRHGETAWSLTGQHTGSTELPLTPRGEEEARALRPFLQGIPFARVFASPRQRAQQTCALAGITQRVEIEPDLAEWNYGEYEGRRSDSIHAERPNWDIFADGCPGGETPADISDRADRLIFKLRTMQGDVALFTHGHIGRVIAVRWIAAPMTLGRSLAMSTASVSVMGYEERHPDTPVLELWNAVPGRP